LNNNAIGRKELKLTEGKEFEVGDLFVTNNADTKRIVCRLWRLQ
jgi:hypothetical protein